MKIIGILIIGIILHYVSGAPEAGVINATLTKEHNIISLPKTLYENATVTIKVGKSSCDAVAEENPRLRVMWLVRSTSCYGEYVVASQEDVRLELLLQQPQYSSTVVSSSGIYEDGQDYVNCGSVSHIESYSGHEWNHFPLINTTMDTGEKKDDGALTTTEKPTSTTAKQRKRRDEDNQNPKPATKDNNVNNKETAEVHSSQSTTTVPSEAPYIVVVKVDQYQENLKSFHAEVIIEMKNPTGYLSAHDYPLLTFYMIMCIVYSIYAFAWLVMSALNFKDLLRVQFWIGGVILLGMIEKAVFYSEYLNVNTTGVPLTGASKFAEVVSAMKRALARMLVIIVSLGFGIVKPRLGPMLHRVIGIGILYFIVAVIEALVRTDSAIPNLKSSNMMFASIPLAIIDSIICWWIFMSLLQTMKTLRLRRNVIKLSLYRHFSNAIIFCVIASIAMIFYSLRYRDECMTDWEEVWVDTAFWHILFSIILLVIMVLWRPNINNQRYAFSPLIDGDEDVDPEANEPILGSGTTETIKMRGAKPATSRDRSNDVEESLKWVEDNIPQTVADAALPAIMDSDEEIMTTKYEMSKME